MKYLLSVTFLVLFMFSASSTWAEVPSGLGCSLDVQSDNNVLTAVVLVERFERLLNPFLYSRHYVPAQIQFLDEGGNLVETCYLSRDATSSHPLPESYITNSMLHGVGRRLKIYVNPVNYREVLDELGVYQVKLKPGRYQMRIAYSHRALLPPRREDDRTPASLLEKWKHPKSLETAFYSNTVTIDIDHKRPIMVPPYLAKPDTPLKVELLVEQDGQSVKENETILFSKRMDFYLTVENVTNEIVSIEHRYMDSEATYNCGGVMVYSEGEFLGDAFHYTPFGGHLGLDDIPIKLPPGGIIVFKKSPTFYKKTQLRAEDRSSEYVAIETGDYELQAVLWKSMIAKYPEEPSNEVIAQSRKVKFRIDIAK